MYLISHKAHRDNVRARRFQQLFITMQIKHELYKNDKIITKLNVGFMTIATTVCSFRSEKRSERRLQI